MSVEDENIEYGKVSFAEILPKNAWTEAIMRKRKEEEEKQNEREAEWKWRKDKEEKEWKWKER